MKKLIATAALLFVLPPLALAQNTDHQPKGLGYAFLGAGTHEMTPTAGFGGEVYVAKGLGMGVEVGGAGLSAETDPNKMLGVGSADLSYHFFPKKIRGNAAPFVAGGYTLFFGHNAAVMGKDVTTNGFNVGGALTSSRRSMLACASTFGTMPTAAASSSIYSQILLSSVSLPSALA